MRTIEVNMMVDKNRETILQFPPDITPGEYRAVIVIEEGIATKEKRPPLNFPVDSYGSWPEKLSLRREDIYNEWGR
jgi:hypothetical protein